MNFANRNVCARSKLATGDDDDADALCYGTGDSLTNYFDAVDYCEKVCMPCP